MKYVIKLTLERDGELEKEWAIGCVLPIVPSVEEIATAKQELFKAVEMQVKRLSRDVRCIIKGCDNLVEVDADNPASRVCLRCSAERFEP